MISNICVYYKMSTLIDLVNIYHPHVCVQVSQLYSALCDPIDYIARQAPLSMEFSR